ncbi:MAG: hypothetical protein DCF32_04165 [Leptolyngbya sp.]|nr:MAG: hypothetical protein DCF32_04165 [Leptolyngbya sp.]
MRKMEEIRATEGMRRKNSTVKLNGVPYSFPHPADLLIPGSSLGGSFTLVRRRQYQFAEPS